MAFNISFNKPAHEQLFAGEKVGGVKFEITPDAVRFKPVKEEFGENIIPLFSKVRGGWKSVKLEGPFYRDLLAALTNPSGHPFFTLTRLPKGWFEAKPWGGPEGKDDKSTEPSRLKPNLRVWAAEDAKNSIPSHINFVRTPVQIDEDDVIAANSPRDLLLQLQSAISGIADVPLGQALTKTREIEDIMERLKTPLERAAQDEAVAIRARRKVEQDTATTPPTAAKAPVKSQAVVMAKTSHHGAAPATATAAARTSVRGTGQHVLRAKARGLNLAGATAH